jgi:HEAT repeat protein
MEIRNLQGLQDKVSVHLMNISLHEGIRQLLPNVNYCLQEGKVHKKAAQLIFLLASGQQAVVSPGALASEQPADEDEDPEERLTELYALAEQGDEGALRKATSDSNPTIRQTAFALLAKLNPVGAADLAAVASRSSKLEQQYTGLQTLGGLDDPRALQVLGESLANEDMGVREFAVQGLTSQTDPGAIRFLNQALKDPEPSIRMLALEGLAGRGGESRGALTLALQSNDSVIQARAAELLEQITANEEEVISPSVDATIFSNNSN